MGKILAIKGHSTRGEEVIELLKMMGGVPAATKGFRESYCYYISEDTATKYISWDYIGPEEIDKYEIFTLEEFLEKYPFKVGDKVMVDGYNYPLLIIAMQWDSNTIKYLVTDDNNCNLWYTAKDIENMNKIGNTDFVQLGKTVAVCFNKDNYENEVELQLGDYEIEVRDGRTFAVLKKPEYPKTYKKCCSIVGGVASTRHLQYDTTPSYKFEEDLRDSLETLRKLIICRDAYWKIAGEQMGLGKPWKPDWNDEIQKYCIRTDRNKIVNCSSSFNNRILAFPTEEMRDAFYENFKDLIEQCKELI